ncbi:hypothetical protein XENOCAPTIV_011835 [Xenoophorus captivus]|uniref:MH1 domain-containing protein n=1 Tax=Xenoophorus captivus TaxID=1517983 RepID=A0ABV0QD37_9TELE
MFRTKRSGLVRRLWRSRAPVEGDGETDRGTHGSSGGCCMGKAAKVAKSNDAGSEAELKALTHSVLKKIKEKQLEVLLQAVESKGGARSPCLLLPCKVDAKVGQQSYSPPMLLYKVFRWPDLRHSSELKRLSCCESYGKINPDLVCCNPHHMSRLCELGEGVLAANERMGPVHARAFCWETAAADRASSGWGKGLHCETTLVTAALHVVQCLDSIIFTIH